MEWVGEALDFGDHEQFEKVAVLRVSGSGYFRK